MTEVEPAPPSADSSSSVYEWLAGNPLASHAGSTLQGWYESSKGYSRIGDYTLNTIESSVKYAAETAAPVVKKLDKPIQAVDSFAAKQLTKLEEKVPAIKSEPAEVVTYLTESKDAITTKISDGHVAVKNRLSEGKEAITSRVTAGKDAVVSTIQAGTEALSQTRVATLASEGKDALKVKLSEGKDAVATRLTQGKDALYCTVQSGVSAVANTRAGALVGSGVDHSLHATEKVIDYLLPAEENEKELLSEASKEKEPMELTTLKSTTESTVTDEVKEDEEVIVEEKIEEKQVDGRVVRIKTLSRKVKLRLYYRSMRRLQSVQERSKTALEQIKLSIDVLKLAREVRDKAGQHYETVTTSLKDLEDHVKQMLSRTAQGEDKVNWLPDETEEDDQIQWLKPQPASRLQSTFDYIKQLNEKVYSSLKLVSGGASNLPHHLKDGATQAYDYAQELYTNLKTANSPTELSQKALNRISEIVDTQLGYVRGLGTYLTSVLQGGRAEDCPKDDEDVYEETTEDEQDDDDLSVDPSTSQPPGPESEDDPTDE